MCRPVRLYCAVSTWRTNEAWRKWPILRREIFFLRFTVALKVATLIELLCLFLYFFVSTRRLCTVRMSRDTGFLNFVMADNNSMHPLSVDKREIDEKNKR